MKSLYAGEIVRGITISPPNTEAYLPSEEEPISLQDLQLPHEWALKKALKLFLGTPFDAQTIYAIQESVVDFCRNEGLFLAQVTVDKNNNSVPGVLHITVHELVLGKIKSNETRWFANEQLTSRFRAQQGQPLAWDALRDDLSAINENPFHQTTLIFEPGQQPGTVDLRLSTQEHFPLRIYGEYENTGNLVAGNSRYLTGFQWGDAWHMDHQFNILFVSAGDFSKYAGSIATYIAPLPWHGHRFEASGAYLRSSLNSMNGWGSQVFGKYFAPFWLGRTHHEVGIGYTFKRSNNNFFVGENVLRMFDISEFIAFYQVDWNYSVGTTKLALTAYWSPGNMTTFNTRDQFSAIRSGARSNYLYGQIGVDQTFRMPKECCWVLNFLFQQSTAILLPTEEFTLGGFATIRGYEEYAAIGDNGLLLKNEFRTPAWHLPGRQPEHTLEGLLFVDLGWAYVIDHNILSQSSSFLGSAGPGIRYHLSNYISVRFDYGWQFHTLHRLVANPNYQSRGHLNITLSY